MRPDLEWELLDESRLETRAHRCTILDDSVREEAVALCTRRTRGQRRLLCYWATQSHSVPDNATKSSEATIAAAIVET